MQVRPHELPARLRKELAPVYFISGDDTLLVEEAVEAVLAAARARGYSERVVLHAEGNFRWQELLSEGASLSLFSEKKILDVRNPVPKFDKEATEALRDYCTRLAPPDTLLLLRCPRIEGRQKNAAWFKILDAAGVVVQTWPVKLGELPRWLKARLERMDVTLSPEALTFLAQRVEGNLLAAVQEMEKLKIAALPQPVSMEALLAVLEDSAHYDTFELLDAAMMGDAARIPRMVRGLRAEGVALFAILGALTSQLRAIVDGRVPPFRRREADALTRRLGSVAAMDRVLAQCALVDQQLKGQLLGDPWLSMEELLLRLAGLRLPSLENRHEALRRP